MNPRLFLAIFQAASLGPIAHALSLPFSASSKDQVSDNTFDFQNLNNVTTANAIYTTELSVAGQKLIVQLDTGSSDLWFDTTGVDLSGFTDSGVKSSITYLDTTSAQGPVLIGNVTIGSFSTSQAFISAAGSNATNNGDKGLLGVGPPLLSQISGDLSETSFDGSTLLENVFNDEPSLERFITFALSRSQATGATGGGIFTIGEIASNLTAVSSSSHLNVILRDRWTVLMDGMIVNGKRVSGNSAFQDSIPLPLGQTLANLDTGTSRALVPKVYADAIYGSIPGSLFDRSSGVYIVPCDAKINVSFAFGGVEYPVHPIDTVLATVNQEDGSVVCFSGFISVDVDPNQDTQDFLLGDSFLRNVYAVFNFGSFIVGETTRPSIQLLSTIDADKAYEEFDTLSAQRNQSLTQRATSTGSSSTSPPSAHKNSATTLQLPRLFDMRLGMITSISWAGMVYL